MKGRTGKRLRQESAINRIELSIKEYVAILLVEKELLEGIRENKDLQTSDNVPMKEKKIKQFEKKLERAKTTLENTKKNLRH